MTTTVIFDLDGVLVDSRAVFLSCVRHAFAKLDLPERSDEELLPYIGPPFAYAFGELLQVPHDAPIVAACIDGYRERYKDASLTETTVFPGIPEALAALRRPPARGRHLQAARVRRPAAGRDGPARALRARRRPRPDRAHRGQDGDDRPRARGPRRRRAR